MKDPQTLVEFLLAGADFGERPAHVFRTGVRRLTFSYAETVRAAHAVAALLRERGVAPGDRVMLLAPNGPAWAWGFFGILLAGGVVVPADMRATADTTAGIARHAGVTFLLRTGLRPEIAGVPSMLLEDLFWDITSGRRSGAVRPHAAKPADLAEIIYTSGTTGAPKGVMLTHGNLLANLAALTQVVRVSSAQSYVSVLPLSHIFEQVVGLLTFWQTGARIIFLRTVKPSEIFAALREERPTNLLLVPRLLQLFRTRIEHELAAKRLGGLFRALQALAAVLPRSARRALFLPVHARFGNRLWYMVVGGAPLPGDLHRFWDGLGVPVVQGYGLTETSPILACNLPAEQRVGSVGRGLPGQELAIAPDGEVCARGPHVTAGYYRDPEKTAAAFTDGWFRTGDLGELRDGWLVLKGRKKDLIVPAHGGNVYAEDVEAAVARVRGVRDVAVIGKRAAGGEEVHAVLLLEPGAPPPSEIIRQANTALDSTQQIRGWTVWPHEDFPRTPTLKVRKFLVAEALAEKAAPAAGPAPAVPARRERLFALIAAATNRSLSDVRPARRLSADLGLDSVGRLELVSLLETEFTVDIEEAEITPDTTVADLERLVAGRRERKEAFFWQWPFSPLLRLVQWLFRRAIVFPLLRLYGRVEASGAEHLAGLPGPALFAANHVSAIDTAVLLRALAPAARRRIAVFARADLFQHANRFRALRWRLYFFLMSLCLPIVIVPQDRGFRRTLAFAGRFADRGYSFLLFPEGQRTEDGKPLPFRPGAGLAVQELGLPVVPVRTSGLFEILPRTELWPRRRGTVRVVFGAPFRVGAGAPADVARQLQEAVAAL